MNKPVKNSQTPGLSRREFARRVALASAGAAILPGNLRASAGNLVPDPLVQEPPQKLSSAAQAEVEAKVDSILRKYGSRLSDEQKSEIRRLVREGQAPLEKLRAFPLENSNQPATALRLYPDFPSPAQGKS
jgi:hypothetical protein